MYGNAPSQRQLRVGEQLRHLIAETLQRGDFPDAALLDNPAAITVSEVRPSPDLKNATVFVLSLGGKNMTEILETLNQSAPSFQHEINRKLKLKFTPRLTFIKDESFDEAEKIDSIIQNLPPVADTNDDTT